MIGKAAFWLGLLVLLTPHEPDLGLGRPSAAVLEWSADRQDYIAPQQTKLFATDPAHALLSMRDDFLRRVPQMRADIRDSLNRREAAAAKPSRDGAAGPRF